MVQSMLDSFLTTGSFRSLNLFVLFWCTYLLYSIKQIHYHKGTTVFFDKKTCSFSLGLIRGGKYVREAVNGG